MQLLEFEQDEDETSTVAAVVLNDADLLSNVFGYLHWKDILRARICVKWRQAARLTDVPESMSDDIVPTPELYVKNREFAKALSWLANDALPKIPSVNILFNVYTTKPFEIAEGYGSGQPASHQRSTTAGPVDLSHIANFRHLRKLSICGASLRGSYPYMFDFPNLTTLEFVDVGDLVWDLEMLRGVPNLEKLTAVRNNHLTGNLDSIRVVRKTLVKLCLTMCYKVGGDLMDLRDFPRLKEICLIDCNRIGGDIRHIRTGDFLSVESFGRLPDSIFGGSYLPSIAATPAIMQSWYILKKQNPRILSSSGNGLCRLSLSILSTERYSNDVKPQRDMPSTVEFVSAGTRLGWRWTNCCSGGSCETIWLDPAPNPFDEGYDLYLREIQKLNGDVGFYKGLFAPPTQEEHLRRNEAMPFEPEMGILIKEQE
jgi:hypothetical protein